MQCSKRVSAAIGLLLMSANVCWADHLVLRSPDSTVCKINDNNINGQLVLYTAAGNDHKVTYAEARGWLCEQLLEKLCRDQDTSSNCESTDGSVSPTCELPCAKR